MVRRIVLFFVSSFILLLLILSAWGVLVYITPPPPKMPMLPAPPAIGGVSASLIDGNTGDVLAEKEGDLRIYPASTTKMLTCIIALEEGRDKLNYPVTVSKRAMSQDGTNVGLTPSMPISLEQTLYAMMLVSGNDSAVAVAETVAGSYDHFIEMMNEKARNSIGVHHSHFANPNGLTDKNHYSTAHDMAQIGRYAMKNAEFRKIVREKFYDMTYLDGTVRHIENRNEFLGHNYDGANGIKTGMTEAAGECLVASAERNGQLVIVAVYDDKNRWEDVQSWLTYGFAKIRARERYETELAKEPFIYKQVNRILGKESS